MTRALKTQSASKFFSLHESIANLSKETPDLPENQAFDLASRLSVGLYQETLAVRDLTMKVLVELKPHNPHKEGTKEYVDFILQHNFDPDIHPGFFETYDKIVKHYSNDLEPHVVFA